MAVKDTQAGTNKLKQLVYLVNQTYTCSTKNTIANYGCINHYIRVTAPHTNRQPCASGILLKKPDGAVMKSSRTYSLDFPNLPEEFTQAHISHSM